MFYNLNTLITYQLVSNYSYFLFKILLALSKKELKICLAEGNINESDKDRAISNETNGLNSTVSICKD